MKIASGLLILAACMPYMVWAESAAAAAAAAAAADDDDAAAAAAAAAAASGDGSAAAAAAAAASSSFIRGSIYCNCTTDYNPVCGTDGNTYSNVCWLRCVSAEYVRCGYGPIGVHRRGVCPPTSCYCPQVVDPVCGTNNQTYSNPCYLKCENDVRIKNGLKPIGSYKGACYQTTCRCPKAIIPVCGSNGKTYQNICIMECYSRANQARGSDPIYFKHQGACKKETCICPQLENELCASDQNTYYNDCALDCQNWRRYQLGLAPLTIRHRGKCCKCPIYIAPAPVCASNGVTYSNICLFKCENSRRKAAHLPLLYIRWDGQCDCKCNKDYNPVCASDKKTYQNKCVFDCENRRRVRDGEGLLLIVRYGVCYRCDCKRCGNLYKPVCGSNKKTYWNECWLTCNINCRCKAKLPSIWKLYDGECC